MTYAVPLDVLGQLILFIIAVIAGVYFILLLKNLNQLLRDINLLINTNRADLNQALEDLPRITGNTVQVTDDLKERISEIGNSLEVASENVTDTAVTVNKTADQVSTYAIIVSEVVKSVVEYLSKPSGRC